MIAIIVGAPALTILLLIAAAALIGTREGQPVQRRTRLAGWWVLWSLAAAILTLAGGVRRAGGSGWRKLAGRIRAIRQAPQPDAAPGRKPAPGPGRHRKVVTAR